MPLESWAAHEGSVVTLNAADLTFEPPTSVCSALYTLLDRMQQPNSYNLNAEHFDCRQIGLVEANAPEEYKHVTQITCKLSCCAQEADRAGAPHARPAGAAPAAPADAAVTSIWVRGMPTSALSESLERTDTAFKQWNAAYCKVRAFLTPPGRTGQLCLPEVTGVGWRASACCGTCEKRS